MDVTKIDISREDLAAIMEAMAKFPELTHAKLVYEEGETDSSLMLGVMTTVSGMMGHFYIPIAKRKM